MSLLRAPDTATSSARWIFSRVSLALLVLKQYSTLQQHIMRAYMCPKVIQHVRFNNDRCPLTARQPRSALPLLAGATTFLFLPCAKPKLIVRIPLLLSIVTSPEGCPTFSSAEGVGFWLELEPDVALDECDPRPLSDQLTSIPRLMLQSQTSTKTGVLISTLSTGKMSGRRAGGVKRSSATCRIAQAA